MRPILAAAVVFALATARQAAAGEPEKSKKTTTDYINVELRGTLLLSEDGKSWAVKLAPSGFDFTWPVAFYDKDGKSADLEKAARGLRGKAVILTGQLVHIPAQTFNLNPLSIWGTTTFPAYTMITAHTIREAKAGDKKE